MNHDENAERGTWVELPIMVGVALAMVMTWPLLLYLGTDIPAEYGDPLFDSWHVAWVGHALVSQPLDSHVRHLNVLSSGGIALALFLLLRGYRRGNSRLVRRTLTASRSRTCYSATRRPASSARTVLLHPALAVGTPWADAGRRPIARLPLRREVRPDVILYHLQPKRA